VFGGDQQCSSAEVSQPMQQQLLQQHANPATSCSVVCAFMLYNVMPVCCLQFHHRVCTLLLLLLLKLPKLLLLYFTLRVYCFTAGAGAGSSPLP
jgi:hypothetical protein